MKKAELAALVRNHVTVSVDPRGVCISFTLGRKSSNDDSANVEYESYATEVNGDE